MSGPITQTAAEVAEALGLTPQVVSRKAAAGAFPGAFNLGGRAGWRIPVEGVESYKAARRTEKPQAASPATKAGKITI